jgi:integrase
MSEAPKSKPKERGNGDGTMYPLDPANPKGKWVVKFTVGHRDGNPIRRKFTCANKAAAKKKLADLIKSRDEGVIGSSATVQVYVADYLANHFPQRIRNGKKPSASTVANYSTVAQSHIYPRIGHLRLEKLTIANVEMMLLRPMATEGGMKKDGLRLNTVKRAQSVLSLALSHAVRRGDLPRDVAALATLPVVKKAAIPKKAFTRDQATKLHQAAEGDRIGAAVVLGLCLGLRPGELFGLKWSDIHGTALHIERASKLTYEIGGDGNSRGVLVLGSPKTERSIRRPVLPEPCVRALEAHRVIQAAERAKVEKSDVRIWQDNDLIFPTEVGTITDLHNFRREFRKLVEKAGIPDADSWTPNELRHTCITLLYDDEVPHERIEALVGHVDDQMMKRNYLHSVKPVDSAVATMDALFGQGPIAGPIESETDLPGRNVA